MAITVIKHGKLLTATCCKCECIFSFLPSDMQIGGSGLATYEFIKCPDCGYEIHWWYGEKSGRIKDKEKH